jgi:HK97 family phage portal protein
VSLLSNAGATLKRFTSMVFRRSSYRIFSLLGTRIDYADEVGDGTSSSTVAAVLNWVARTFPEAPPALWHELDNGQEQQIRQHDMLKLLRKPNEYYSGLVLWMATVIDWMVDGNAYWLKVRDNGGRVVELWWVPHWMICPKGDETEFVAYYEYTPDTERLRVDPADIVHFRFGLDSEDPKLGMSQLKSVLREVFTDDEAANFTASLLRNMGVPGLVVSPEKGTTLNENDGLEMKKYVKEKFGGDKRGEALVMTGATQIAQFGFSPEQLLLRELRRIPEERVSAVTGIPAIVVGFGAGLERSTFTNMGEARAAAYEAGLIPMQRIMAEDVNFQLLPDFETDPFVFRFGFDLKKVRVLQEDLYRQAQRHDLAIRGGWEQVYEGRMAMGLDVTETDRVFLRPLNIATVPAAGTAPAHLPQANGNGTGAHVLNGHADEIADAVVRAIERRELTTA